MQQNPVPGDVYSFTWKNDFSKARNIGLDKASHPFVMILDGHEKFIDGHAKLRHIAQNPGECEVFSIEVRSRFGELETSFYQERMFANHYRYHNACHNVIVYDNAKGAMLSGVTIEHERSPALMNERRQQRISMNLASLYERVKAGDRRALAQIPQEYISMGDHHKALEALDIYLREDIVPRERYQVLLKAAMLAFWTEQYDRCNYYLLFAGENNDDKRNAHLVMLGTLEKKMGNMAAAESYLQEALTIPKPIYYWFLYPQFYYETPLKILENVRDKHISESLSQAQD